MTIEEIDRELRHRLTQGYADTADLLTAQWDKLFYEVHFGVYTYIPAVETVANDALGKANTALSYITTTLEPIEDYLKLEFLEPLKAMTEAFETPEALIQFLLDVEPGEEAATYELLQLLVKESLVLNIPQPE